MRPTTAVLALLSALGLAACAGARPAPPACQLEFLFKAPDRPFERLGELQEMVRILPPGGAHEALRPAACALGADAVVVTRSMVVNLFDHTAVEGYAIRWRAAEATPPERSAEQPAEPPAPTAK
jgi:hypothetical protein